jgi:small subunit ribosomal protein S1
LATKSVKTTTSKEPKAATVKSSSAASSMEELLKATGYEIKGFKRGDTVKGRVNEITGRAVFIDIGGKAEAIVSDREYLAAKDYIKTLKVGDEITGFVTSQENDSGQTILSLKRAASDSRWKIFEEAFENETNVTVVGKEVSKGGILADAEGVFGFIPSSQLSKDANANLQGLVGKKFEVKVIEVDREQNRLVLSEKAVTEAGEIEARRKLLEAVEINGIYKGKVVGVVPFGAFVEVKIGKGAKAETIEGLVHISEISWEKVEDVAKHLKEGSEVEVRVIGTDEESGKLALSLKQMSDDPWKEMAKTYTVDSKHVGKVVKVMPYGVIVHMAKGIEGLIHASKMPADMAFAEGQEVDTFVESVDMDKRRLSLGVVVKDTKGMIYK